MKQYTFGNGTCVVGFGTSDAGFKGFVLEDVESTTFNSTTGGGRTNCGVEDPEAILVNFASAQSIDRFVAGLLELKKEHF